MNDLKEDRARRNLSLGLRVVLGTLPIGLQLGSCLPIYFFAMALGRVLNLPPDAPVRDHPNGLLWFVLFMGAMLLLQVGGVLLGVSLAFVFLRLGRGWTWLEIHESGVCPLWLAWGLNAITKNWNVAADRGAGPDPLYDPQIDSPA